MQHQPPVLPQILGADHPASARRRGEHELNRIAWLVDHRKRDTWFAIRLGLAWNVPKVERRASSRSSVVL
jgi:hypothetical protein